MGQMTIEEVAKAYRVSSLNTIRDWLKKYELDAASVKRKHEPKSKRKRYLERRLATPTKELEVTKGLLKIYSLGDAHES